MGFVYEFQAEFPLPPESERLIEEKMRQIIREQREIRILEMVPFSARELLLKEGHFIRAEQLSGDGLVEIVQIGPFIDVSDDPHYLSSSSQLGAFKIWPFEDLKEGFFRLSGCACSDKEALKTFLKKLRLYRENNHIVLGEVRGFWRILDEQMIWLSAGLEEKRRILKILKDSICAEALEVSFPDRNSALELRKALFKEMRSPLLIAEIYEVPRPFCHREAGLFPGEEGTQIQIDYFSSFELEEKKLSSSLQLVGKTLTILGLPYQLRLSGRKRSDRSVQVFLESLSEGETVLDFSKEKTFACLEFLVEDNLGRKWPAFSLEGMERGFVLKASIERLVAFLLEKSLCTSHGKNEKPTNGRPH